jgi:hypothetical protein
MAANTLADFQKKTEELKAMARALEEELTSEVTQYLKNAGESIAKLKEINPSFNVTALGDWETLTLKFGVEASVAPVKIPGKRGRPAKVAPNAATSAASGKRIKAVVQETPSDKLTMKEAVLQVLGKRPTSIPDIVEAVSKIKSDVKTTSVYQAINQLKKSKEIKAAARGEYVKS